MIMNKKEKCNMGEWLNSNTKIGLNLGQLMSVIGVLITVMVMWGNFQVKIANIEQKQLELEQRINNTDNLLETLRKENREEHTKVSDKIDDVIFLLTKK